MLYLLTFNTEERIAQNIYIHNSNRNYKENLSTTTILIKKQIGIGYKKYRKQCPGLEFRLILKLISCFFFSCWSLLVRISLEDF